MSISAALPTVLLAHPTEASYLATSVWEAYAVGEHQIMTISRALRVHLGPTVQGTVLTIEVDPPSLEANSDLSPLVELAQQLAGLYARLELLLTPAGEVSVLLNYAALRQAGEQLLAELQAAVAPDDQITATLLAFARRQLASPAALLDSLSFDYLYQTLLASLNGQLTGTVRPPRQFAGFFDKVPLWFTEQALLEPAVGVARLRLHGSLDEQRTDLVAVRAHQAKALQLATPSQAPTNLPAPHFHYEAAYILGQAIGLPLSAELTVYARAGELLNKEYHLTLERL